MRGNGQHNVIRMNENRGFTVTQKKWVSLSESSLPVEPSAPRAFLCQASEEGEAIIRLFCATIHPLSTNPLTDLSFFFCSVQRETFASMFRDQCLDERTLFSFSLSLSLMVKGHQPHGQRLSVLPYRFLCLILPQIVETQHSMMKKNHENILGGGKARLPQES